MAAWKAFTFPGAGGGNTGVHVWSEPYRYAWADGLLSRLLTPHTDYAREVGDGRDNGIVQAALGWICRAFPEAPVRVLDADDEEVEGHPLTALLRRPNPYYSGALLWSATIADRALTGNAYWLKARNGAGQVVELWYTPAHLMAPRWPESGAEFISHYEYSPNGTPTRVEVPDVVHFRYGIDPVNPRLGRSPLAAVLGEVYTDQEAARFTGALLRNMGVPGVILSPSEKDADISESEAEQLRDRFDQRFGGNGRGRTMVMMGPTKVDTLSFSPEQMDLASLRRVPEERITAALGVPAIVAGMGAGLERSTFANFKEAREAAYEENIIPTQRLVADELTIQLLPEFGGPDLERVDFDYGKVRVLQEDQNELARRFNTMLRAGAITVAEYRTALGLDTAPEHEVYYVPNSNTRVPAGELAAPPVEPVAVAPRRAPLALTEGEEGEEAPEEAEPKGWRREAKGITVLDADEAEALFERQLARAAALGPEKSNGRH